MATDKKRPIRNLPPLGERQAAQPRGPTMLKQMVDPARAAQAQAVYNDLAAQSARQRAIVPSGSVQNTPSWQYNRGTALVPTGEGPRVVSPEHPFQKEYLHRNVRETGNFGRNAAPPQAPPPTPPQGPTTRLGRAANFAGRAVGATLRGANVAANVATVAGLGGDTPQYEQTRQQAAALFNKPLEQVTHDDVTRFTSAYPQMVQGGYRSAGGVASGDVSRYGEEFGFRQNQYAPGAPTITTNPSRSMALPEDGMRRAQSMGVSPTAPTTPSIGPARIAEVTGRPGESYAWAKQDYDPNRKLRRGTFQVMSDAEMGIPPRGTYSNTPQGPAQYQGGGINNSRVGRVGLDPMQERYEANAQAINKAFSSRGMAAFRATALAALDKNYARAISDREENQIKQQMADQSGQRMMNEMYNEDRKFGLAEQRLGFDMGRANKEDMRYAMAEKKLANQAMQADRKFGLEERAAHSARIDNALKNSFKLPDGKEDVVGRQGFTKWLASQGDEVVVDERGTRVNIMDLPDTKFREVVENYKMMKELTEEQGKSRGILFGAEPFTENLAPTQFAVEDILDNPGIGDAWHSKIGLPTVVGNMIRGGGPLYMGQNGRYNSMQELAGNDPYKRELVEQAEKRYREKLKKDRTKQ